MILEVLDVVLLFFLLVLAFFIAISRHLVTSTILLSAFSSVIALIYLVVNAPDVAMTEASVGAGLGTIFMFAALSLIRNHKVYLIYKPVTFFFILFLLLLLLFFMIELPDFGTRDAPVQMHLASYYIDNVKGVTGASNLVTAILANFRYYDTFGETLVVFTAALCITLTLKREEDDFR